jgi:hypothetical protein
VLSTSQSRRAAGLLAVTTIGLSTAVLSVAGVASAAPTSAAAPLESISFTTTSDGGYDQPNTTSFTIPDGYCSVHWSVYGGRGGGDAIGGSGHGAGSIGATTTVVAGQRYDLFPGTAGGDATQTLRAAVDPDTTAVGEALVPVPGRGGSGGENGKGNNGAAGSEASNAEFGGGGGAMSEVYLGTVRQISAFGGDGGGSGGGAGAGDEVNFLLADVEPAWNTSDASGNGSIDGQVVPCAPVTPPGGGGATVTGAPIVHWVGGVENGLNFQLTISMVAGDNPVTGVEYSLNGAAFAPIATENAGNYQYSGTITGLQPATQYSVSFRFATAQGHSDPSSVTTAKTAVPGPVGVTAVAGASSIKVNWTAPADMTGVVGYVALAAPDGDQSSAREVSCQPAAALGTSCVLPAIPGLTYGVKVDSLDATGDRIGSSDWVVTGLVSAPAVATTLPKSDGALTSDDADGKVVAGEKITISGKDFLPGSTVDVIVYSTPVKLGSVVVGTDGTFSYTVTLPKDLENGVHHLVASGVDINGNARNMVVEVTVSGGTAVLAFTGFSALPYLGGGALAVLAGAGLLVASRRRQAA